MRRNLLPLLLAALVCLAIAQPQTQQQQRVKSAKVASKSSADASSAGAAAANSKLVLIDDSNWQQVLTGEWMIQFHAPWCPACRATVDSWNELASRSASLKIRVGRADVTLSPRLSGRFFITALPTIMHVRDGQFRQYRGPRDVAALSTMVSERRWTQMEAVPWWKHPNSLQMSTVAWFFELSHLLKEWNQYLTETYRYPAWMTYGLFACVTIALGAIIGLFFVCVVDMIVPPRRKSFEEQLLQQQQQQTAAGGAADPLAATAADDEYAADELEVEEPASGDNDDDTSDGERNSEPDSDEERERQQLADEEAEKKRQIRQRKLDVLDGKAPKMKTPGDLIEEQERLQAKAEREAADAEERKEFGGQTADEKWPVGPARRKARKAD